MRFAVFFLAAAAFLASTCLAATPDQCLRKISSAMEKGDAAAFEQAIDMDAIINQAMEMFISEMQKPENGSQIAPMLALLFSQAKGDGAQAIRNLLRQETKAFVLNGVKSGAFAGRQIQSQQLQGYLAPLFSGASMGRKEIVPVGEPVADENGWFMPFSVYDHGNGQTYALIGRFAGNADGPCLAGIENLDQVFYQIKKESE